ncbi:hypothetical protein T10_243 [Trichinella papuae]|uniref:Uncharacterized protein n=1 Tax=Trichinella papuae TaxID=268474 RepID=A0A0V1N8V9_9BILA|nr:hypothetical protein T10_243 [Trichinella papuae]
MEFVRKALLMYSAANLLYDNDSSNKLKDKAANPEDVKQFNRILFSKSCILFVSLNVNLKNAKIINLIWKTLIFMKWTLK